MTRLVNAQYREAEILDYEGHPLITALPPINSPQATAEMLSLTPNIPEAEKTLPPHIRRHAMMRILDQFLHPTKSHLQLEQLVSGMLRRGYLGRNIAGIEYQRNLNDVGRTDFNAILRNAGSAALTSSVIGCSGTGKSTAIEAILKHYDQALYHPQYQHTQLVWLKVECPHDGSVKSLCTHFFRAVDDALDTDYERLYFKSSSSAERMLADIARVAALHSLGLLVLDEVQHLEKSRSGGADKILNFFVTLTNVIKVPVLFIGTPKALDLFKPTMRSARRASQFGSLDWERFSCVQQGNAPSEWKHFFKRLWKLQWLSSPTPYSEDMNELFWDLTQGIAHIAVALFYLSQTRAVTAMKTPILSEELVIKTYNEELSLIHPMVMALRSENPERIKEYADLDVPIEAIRLKATAPLAMPEALTVEEERASEEAKEPSTFQRLSSILANFGIGEDIIPAIASQAIEENPDADIWTLVEHVKRLEDPQKGNAEKKAPASDKAKVKALQPRYTENDLRLMRQNDAEKSYQHFKKKGVIIDFLAYL